MHKYKIELVTITDIQNFVNVVSSLPGKVMLTDGSDFCVNAKSLLGAMATVEWNELYCVASEPIYTSIQKFCIS